MQIHFWTTGTPSLTIPGLLSFELDRKTDGSFLFRCLGDNYIPVPAKFKQLVIDRIFVPNTIIVKSGSIELPDTPETYDAIAEFYTAFLGDWIETKVYSLQVVEERVSYMGNLVINGKQFEYTARCTHPMRDTKVKLMEISGVFNKLFGEQGIVYELRHKGGSAPIKLTPEVITLLDSTVGSSIGSLERSMEDRVWGKPDEYLDTHSFTTSWFKPTTTSQESISQKALTDLSVPQTGWVKYPPVVPSNT
jgi:hypothetical protein